MVISMVIPIALQNLINVGVQAVDVLMLGKVSETVLSASSLGGQISYIMTLIFFGITSGATVLTAQYWGKQDLDSIEKILGIALRIAAIVSCVFMIAAMAVPQYLMRIYTSEPDVMAEGIRYLRIVCFSYVLMAISMVYLNVLKSMERVVVATVCYGVSFMTNVVVNAVLIFGIGPFPKLGIAGAAIGTVCARAVEVLVICIYAGTKQVPVRFRWKYFIRMDQTLLKDFLIFSMPVVLNELMWGLGTSMNTAIMGHLGKSVVAANSVAQVVRQLVTVVSFGIASVAAIVIGKTIGQGEMKAAEVYGGYLVKLTVGVSIIGAGIVLLLRPVLVGQMELTVQAQDYLSMMMIVMSYFVICQGYNTTMIVGIFRGGGDTKFGLIMDVSTMWCCSIIIGALAAFVWKLPVTIVYMILLGDEVIKLPLSTWRYKQRKWLRNVTR
ncbi:MAG: MATE family efflux transporter [Lachnospiraceae bacterium]